MGKLLIIARMLLLLPLPLATGQVVIDEAFPNLNFTLPVDLQYAPDGSDRLFVVEQEGYIYVFENDPFVTDKTLFLDIHDRVVFGGESGLLGLAFHPDYENNGYFFVNYTAPNPLRTVVSRFQVTPDNPDVGDELSEHIIIQIDQPFDNHNGGQIVFGPEGYLYIGMGDGGWFGDPYNNGQDLTTLLGAILRIDVDTVSANLNYGIPVDNPFVSDTLEFMDEIYAYGLRNPWRFSFDSYTNSCWIADVGQELYEEIDILVYGGNYGWNIMEGSYCYNPATGCDTTGLILPIYTYDHSIGESITGGYVYRGTLVPDIYGKYIFADFIYGDVWSLEFAEDSSSQVEVIGDLGAHSVTSFGVDQQDELYICSYDGNIYKLLFTGEYIAISNDSLIVLEDSSITLDILNNDLLLNITSFTLAIVDSADNGTIALVGDTALTYTPDENFFGYDTVQYALNGSTAIDTGFVFITVVSVNDAPVASNTSVTTDEDIAVEITLTATDVDGAYLTYVVVDSPAYGTVSDSGYSLNFDGVDDYVGTGTSLLNNLSQFTMYGWISPENYGSDIGFFGQNDCIEFGFYDANTIIGWTNYGGFVSWVFNDATFSLNTMHHIVLVGSGYDLKIYVDGDLKATGGSSTSNYSTSTYDFNIGGGGIWDASGNWFNGSIDEVAIWNIALDSTQIQANLYSELSGSENGLISYWNFNEGSGTTLTDQTSNGNDGTIYGATWSNDSPVGGATNTYTPNYNYNGSDSFVYSASDGTLSDTATVSITITAVDDTPVASNDTVTTNEDTDYSGTLMASDGDGDALTFSIIDSTVNGTVTLSDPATGTFTYSPLANFNGSDSLLFSASDGILLDTGSVTIVVTTIDDLPVVANPLPDITVNEDASDTTLGDLKNVFLDVDEELIYSHVVNDTGLVFVSVTNDTVTLQFLTDANGSTEIVFTATNPTTRASVSDTALITVLPMNDAPEIISAFLDTSMVEDETLSLTIEVYDVDGDSLTIYGESDTGAVNVNWDGELITMTSAVDWNGSAGITVFVMDDSSAGDTANFTLTVEPANDSPEEFSVIYPTVSDTFSTHSDNDTLIQFRWGKSNDIDSDITYKLTIELEFFGNTYTDIHENISDTTIGVSSNSLDPMLNVISEEEAGFTYYVHASDDEYNVASDVGEFVLSRAALGAVDGYAIPEQFSLHQNYPNPFNPVTTLRYDLPENGHVNITIYDMLGRKVKTLINHTQDAGYRSIIWDATNDYGKPVSAGIYLYQIQAGEYISTKKMVLLK